jgi:predicted secreted acid phosphatase
VVTYNARDKFLLTKSTKKVLRRVNFTNLKTQVVILQNQNPQGVCLQLSQIPGVIMQFRKKKKKKKKRGQNSCKTLGVILQFEEELGAFTLFRIRSLFKTLAI